MGIPGVQAPTRLGRYELLARLATGGMGEIFLARLEGAAGFEKLFVVKRILPHLADDQRFRQMLIAEARLSSRLSHANICQVYELGETDGNLYIVMEYLDGITLLPLLRKASKEGGALDFGFVGGVLQQASDALHYAHELKEQRTGENLGIVHRDVTPSNVFLTEAGVAKVLDFGIAKVKDASSNTQTGTVKGKYAYMAPEQLRGGSLDRRADVFALGVVAFEMIALRRLFQRKTDYLTFRAVMEQPIPDVRRYRADVPEALAAVLSKALERDPNNRFESARQFGTAVLDAVAPLRPWSQGEISDFIRKEFATDILKRNAAVQTAVARTSSGMRSTMPLIAHNDGPATELDDEDDDEFPAVDSTINEAPVQFRQTRTPQDGKDFAGNTNQVTPPPFGNETSTSGVAIQPLPAMSMPHVQMQPAKPSRSVVWPLLAIAMVGIAGGALFLVWKQMDQRQQAPAVVNITSSSADEDRAANPPPPPPVADPTPPVADPTPPPVADKIEKPDKVDRPAAKVPTPPKGNPYTAALQTHRPGINQCAQDHGAPPAGVKVVIVVSTDGRAKTISLEPAGLNGTPLGTCIKNVLSTSSFPKDKDEKQVSVTFKTS